MFGRKKRTTSVTKKASTPSQTAAVKPAKTKVRLAIIVGHTEKGTDPPDHDARSCIKRVSRARPSVISAVERA